MGIVYKFQEIIILRLRENKELRLQFIKVNKYIKEPVALLWYTDYKSVKTKRIYRISFKRL